MQISEKTTTFALVIELERHIEILLLSNDCVIVPGLGGFMTNHVDARYDDDDSMFLPPLRTLGFNPKLTLNDSLLAQSYIEAYDISYPEAVHRIEDEVNELRQHIENDGSYELNDIGTLFLNEDGNYEFTPCEAGILTPSLYALSSFEIEKQVPVVQVHTKETSQPRGKDKTAATPQPETAQEVRLEQAESLVPPLVQPILDDDASATETTARTVSIRVSLLRNLAAAAIVLVAFLLYSSPLDEKSPSAAALDSSMLLKVMPKNATKGHLNFADAAPSPSAAANASLSAPASSTTKTAAFAASERNTADQQAATVEKPFYTIVLASHVTKANANAYVEELKKQGFAAEVLTRSSTKVIFGKFATQSDAYNKLNQLSGNKPFAEAWVLKIEKP